MEKPALQVTKSALPLKLNHLSQNIFYSFLAQVMPLFVSIVTIPALIRNLGDERFGILSLSWIFLGYFTLFDLGLGRATTKFVSEYIAQGREQEISTLVWTSWALLLALGIGAGVILVVLLPLILQSIQMPTMLYAETQWALVIIACSVPVVIYTTSIRAVLEAYQRFGLLARITAPANILTYLLPFCTLWFSYRIDIIVLILFVSRLVFLGIYLQACFSVVPKLWQQRKINLQLLKPLVHFGGWLTITNILSPLMSYLDRFMVGALVSVSAITYYVTPYEMLRKLQFLPASFMAVLFPTFTQLNVRNQQESADLFHRALRLLFLLALPIFAVFIVLAKDVLTLWIGEDFAVHSTPVLQWLALGIFINYSGQVAYNWIQAMGHANVTAKFHLIELPVYLALIWFLAGKLGIVGVALAWVLRVLLDTGLLYGFVLHAMPKEYQSFRYIGRLWLLAVGLYTTLYLMNISSGEMFIRWGGTAVILLGYAAVVVVFFLHVDEKEVIHQKFLRWL